MQWIKILASLKYRVRVCFDPIFGKKTWLSLLDFVEKIIHRPLTRVCAGIHGWMTSQSTPPGDLPGFIPIPYRHRPRRVQKAARISKLHWSNRRHSLLTVAPKTNVLQEPVTSRLCLLIFENTQWIWFCTNHEDQSANHLDFRLYAARLPSGCEWILYWSVKVRHFHRIFVVNCF